MKLLCPLCNKMPLIKFSFIRESKVMAIIFCKCGKKYHDLNTFFAQYTDIFINDKPDENLTPKKDSTKLIAFCETCFENLYDTIPNEHKNHKIIKIDAKNPIMTDEEFIKITEKIEKAEEKITVYLPEMRDMLIEDGKTESDKKEIKILSEINIDRNRSLLDFLKMIYRMYEVNKKNNTLIYQIMQNLKINSDYNLNKYNLDLKNINKERFVSFLKSCIILSCNSYINKVYKNYFKERNQLKKMILDLKPLKEFNGDDTPVEIDEMIKSNSSIYFGEKNKINNLAYGRGFLYCTSGSHYFGYFKNDFFQCGFGKSINKNGNVYFGEFKDGFANGYGKFITKNGNIYKGDWANNKLNGYGYISWDNGQVYYGDMINGTFSGLGVLYYKNGNLYTGQLKDGKMDGMGKILYKNKKEYLGEFQGGNKTGYGIMKWPTEEKYEGLWENDSFKFGQYCWPNGNIYLGNFKNDSVNGFGTFYNSALGTIETGEWKDGRRVDINQKDNIPATRYLSYL